jgi:serine protease Do
MDTRERSLFTWLVVVVVIAVILLYIPYLARHIGYEKTSSEVYAYKNLLASVQKGDTLSPLFRAVSKTIIPAVVVVQVIEHVENQPETSPDTNDFLRWFFSHPGSSGPSAPQAPKKHSYRYGLGSGIVIDAEKGYILTNWHVVHGADTVVVTLADGRNFRTQWVRTDSRSDLAVVKIDALDLISASLGNSDKMQVGDWVLAVGAPEGLPHTVTAGIISAKGRTTSDGRQTFLQTDAAINPGNSGGPLANMQGQVIGINTAIISPVGANEGIGLVIPSNTAKIVMKQLIEKGKVVRGYLGVEITDANDQTAKALNLPDTKGSLVVSVTPGSPAQKAGLMPNDFIVSVNGKKIADTFELLNEVTSIEPGQNAAIELYRKGKKQTVTVQVGSLPEQNLGPQPNR